MVVPLTVFSPDRKKARDSLTCSLPLSNDLYPCSSPRGIHVANYIGAGSKAQSGAQLQFDSAYKETEVGGQLSVFTASGQACHSLTAFKSLSACQIRSATCP